ncbi:hypothetical protein [Streptococcus loxodontisalivarius]|uniref:Nucleic acid-binding Zn ribbon protein n=1 Tax=Streptococcus loxodontisalivarius TaxID=1349415 RepID=A0ABS2PUX2_9STRE|nr:hypothetical protein [Streptococcus loxodontisalivarius]MBM7643748.1 putative nucleic acid-binding Zn ribbon protein [Streptococcus loxodontisalivarius]
MKIRVGDYHVVGAIGKRGVLIHKDLKGPFYVSREEDNPEAKEVRIPAGMTFVVTIMIRAIDSKNLQASLLLLLLGFLLVFLSVKWAYRKFPNRVLEVKEYQFDSPSLEEILNDMTKRNNALMKFLMVFLLITIIFAILYLKTNFFIFLFMSVGFFLATDLMSQYQCIQRMFVLYKLKKMFL